VALGLQPLRELARERRLAGALEAGQHDDRRRVLRVPDEPGLAAEDVDELLVDDLDDLLGRVQRLADLLARGPLLDRADEGLDDRQRDVRLEQRDPDLAGRRVDVGVGQPALAAQRREDLVQPVGEGVEHDREPSRRPTSLASARASDQQAITGPARRRVSRAIPS